MESTDNSSTNDNRQITRASGTVMFAFIIGQIFSLASSILISWKFGTSVEYDAFIAANKIPDIIYQLVAAGALASAFVPTFTGLLTRGDRERGWKLASAVVNWVTILLIAICTLSAIFAPWIVRNVLNAPLLNHGLVDASQTDPLKFQYTVNLLRIQLIAPILFGISGLLMGIINSHQSFLWPALAPAMLSVGKIVGVLLLAPSMDIYGLAVGFLLGALMHGLIQLPALIKLPKVKYFFTLGKDLPETREVVRLMGPRVLGVAFVQLNSLVNTIIAYGLPTGSVGAIGYSFGLMMIPEIAIAQSMAIAALPTFSAQVAKGKPEDMRASLSALLRGLLLLSIPASLGLIFLRVPLITLLYQRGTFDSHSTQMVAWALLFYAAGLVGHSVVEIVSRAFYALHDTKTPVFVGVVMMSLNVVLSLWFASLFVRIGWMPHGALALANSLATFFEMCVLLFFIRRKISGLEGRHTLDGLFRALAAGALMSAALWAWLKWTQALPVWLIAIGGVLVGVLVYMVGLILFRVPELQLIRQLSAKIFERLGIKKKGAV